jgi:hypothetical protein
MGHSVTALLGTQAALSAFAAKEEVGPPVQAKADVWLLPLPEEAIDKIVGLPVGTAIEGFNYLFPKLLAKLELASANDWIVYAETEYFGGTGGQGAVALRRGGILYGPTSAEWGCINQALASVGIKVAPPAQDEFETIGFDTHRFTEDWLPESEDGDA